MAKELKECIDDARWQLANEWPIDVIIAGAYIAGRSAGANAATEAWADSIRRDIAAMSKR